MPQSCARRNVELPRSTFANEKAAPFRKATFSLIVRSFCSLEYITEKILSSTVTILSTSPNLFGEV